jgi:anaphase-promoting complex subunit 4
MSSLDLNSFSHLGTFTVTHDTRLVSGACNPEKDLVLLIHRTESRETLSLWKLQGSKRWEMDVASNFIQNGALRHIAWSPDGEPYVIYYNSYSNLIPRRQVCHRARFKKGYCAQRSRWI